MEINIFTLYIVVCIICLSIFIPTGLGELKTTNKNEMWFWCIGALIPPINILGTFIILFESSAKESFKIGYSEYVHPILCRGVLFIPVLLLLTLFFI